MCGGGLVVCVELSILLGGLRRPVGTVAERTIWSLARFLLLGSVLQHAAEAIATVCCAFLNS